MFAKTILVALFAAAAVSAAPTETAAQVEARQLNQAVSVCSDKNFADCDRINFTFGVCVNNIGRLNDKVSSLDARGFNCIFFNDTGCRPGGGQIATSGQVSDIRSNPQFKTMNDDVSSFICSKD